MVVVLVGGTLTVEICSHWSRGPDFREPSYSRAIAYATLCCSGFNHLLLSLSIPNCLFSHIVKFDAQQWRWKIFEQCQRYWILATAFTEESCLLRARQPSSMLDLAKGNEVRLSIL
ncbi:hypothetical protein NC653_024062 [Populus alba x Populus x berolinensis]|uniref:Uncharacterized protein n=1 Tax=Populus alba x Populus x berolinensis TaxID=444605 RepID=A0AAD6QBQ5_9ROSI|nr:hypothetical protein NC653_024053 [Populus alba x Populus x berolinensis]KAJ6986361.1 hypothetical protein NC653_024062 [Populus alba x Populus x berolinensis]